MQINIGSLKHNTLLYINLDENCEDASSQFNNFFKHCLVVKNLEDSKRLFNKISNEIDLIIIETLKISKNEIDILTFIINIDTQIPIIFISNEINNTLLVKGKEYYIDSFLSRPYKVQDLTRLCCININTYEANNKNKDALKIFSKQLKNIKEEKLELIKEIKDTHNLLDFYVQFQENYLQFVKIDKKGVIKFISEELKKELQTDYLENNFIQIFEDTSKVQSALISSMKERKINTVTQLKIKNENDKKWTINILPSLENEKELYSFNIFFYMT